LSALFSNWSVLRSLHC